MGCDVCDADSPDELFCVVADLGRSVLAVWVGWVGYGGLLVCKPQLGEYVKGPDAAAAALLVLD